MTHASDTINLNRNHVTDFNALKVYKQKKSLPISGNVVSYEFEKLLKGVNFKAVLIPYDIKGIIYETGQ